MVELIEEEFGLKAECKQGRLGEFAVLVNDRVVARKKLVKFPSDREVVSAIRQALDDG